MANGALLFPRRLVHARQNWNVSDDRVPTGPAAALLWEVLMATDRFEKGMETRRAVLGNAYVDRKNEQTHDFDNDYQRFVTETVWADVWSREGLDRRTRSLVTLAIAAAACQEEEFALHLRGARNNGCTPEEIREMLLHVAAYAGVAAANTAHRIAKRILAEEMVGGSI
jgi:4-carboxymuconolactone decarboxylase